MTNSRNINRGLVGGSKLCEFCDKRLKSGDPRRRFCNYTCRITAWTKNNPRDNRIGTLQVYGLTKNSYDEILKKQNGLCLVCLNPVKNPAVDHAHNSKSKKVRGILCNKHNSGIGMLEDNIQYLENAIKYLKENNG